MFSFSELADLIRASRPFLGLISKAKASKLVRGLVDMFLDMEAGTGIEVQLCKVSIHCITGCQITEATGSLCHVLLLTC